MIRFDYLPRRFTAFDGVRTVCTAPSMRGPVAAIAAAVLLFGATCSVQLLRLHALDGELRAIAERRAEQRPALARLAAARRAVARSARRAAAREAVRRSGRRAANEVASLGNALPGGVWVSSLRVTPHAIALDGRASRIDDVANALASLAHVRGVAAARLLSVHAEPARDVLTYAFELDRVP